MEKAISTDGPTIHAEIPIELRAERLISADIDLSFLGSSRRLFRASLRFVKSIICTPSKR